MSKPINKKCAKCAKIDIRTINPRPLCYWRKECRGRRNYYRHRIKLTNRMRKRWTINGSKWKVDQIKKGLILVVEREKFESPGE